MSGEKRFLQVPVVVAARRDELRRSDPGQIELELSPERNQGVFVQLVQLAQLVRARHRSNPRNAPGSPRPARSPYHPGRRHSPSHPRPPSVLLPAAEPRSPFAARETGSFGGGGACSCSGGGRARLFAAAVSSRGGVVGSSRSGGRRAAVAATLARDARAFSDRDARQRNSHDIAARNRVRPRSSRSPPTAGRRSRRLRRRCRPGFRRAGPDGCRHCAGRR